VFTSNIYIKHNVYSLNKCKAVVKMHSYLSIFYRIIEILLRLLCNKPFKTSTLKSVVCRLDVLQMYVPVSSRTAFVMVSELTIVLAKCELRWSMSMSLRLFFANLLPTETTYNSDYLTTHLLIN